MPPIPVGEGVDLHEPMQNPSALFKKRQVSAPLEIAGDLLAQVFHLPGDLRRFQAEIPLAPFVIDACPLPDIPQHIAMNIFEPVLVKP